MKVRGNGSSVGVESSSEAMVFDSVLRCGAGLSASRHRSTWNGFFAGARCSARSRSPRPVFRQSSTAFTMTEKKHANRNQD